MLLLLSVLVVFVLLGLIWVGQRVSTRSVVCPRLEWLVTTYRLAVACAGRRESLAGLLFSIRSHG